MSLTNSPFWMASTGDGGFYDHQIDGSLRFNDNDNANLSRTFSSGGNRKTWTLSMWYKRSTVNSSSQVIFAAGSTSSTSGRLYVVFEPDDLVVAYGSGNWRNTNAVYRDTSSWYHLVLAVDSTQGTASNRMKIYINGEQVTSFSSNNTVALNQNFAVNNNVTHRIGSQQSPQSYFDGYIADVNFVDGSQLDPTSFGETKSGIWIPKAYSGSYGTNGFHLEFAGNANDSSGNGNNWTTNNISSYDYVPDSPTNNFATFNPLDRNSTSITSLEGNLRISQNTGSYLTMRSTMAIPQSGKWYCEFRCDKANTSGSSSAAWGLQSTQEIWATNFGNNSKAVAFYATNGNNATWFRVGGSDYGYGGSNPGSAFYMNAGDIFQIAVDADSGKVWLGRNNQWYGGSSGAPTANSGNPANGTNPIDTLSASDLAEGYLPMIVNSDQNGTRTWRFNAGQDSTFQGAETAGNNSDANGVGDFHYAPPSGYLALCTSNLPDPGIDPAADETPEDYFNTKPYSGTNATHNVTGVGFKPDWVWIKRRNAGYNSQVFDAVRGAGANKELTTNETYSEGGGNSGTYGYLSSFNTDGFTLTPGSTNSSQNNESGGTYVAWNWLAGNGTSSNTDGSTTTTVSVNSKAGFSIATYTGTNSNATIGHGLDSAPEMIITKDRDRTINWMVWHKDLTNSNGTSYLALNTTNQDYNDGGGKVVKNVNSSTYTIGAFTAYNANNEDFVAYHFHSVDGYSKFGLYEGNGSSDGAFIFTGFRPSFVMVKRINASGSWEIMDNKRDSFNVVGKQLFANLSNSEFDGTVLDFLSNGFKLRDGSSNHNASGSDYVYMAFAEQPFKYSNAR